MEKYFLDNDIHIFYVQADSFPEGIKPAFEKLHSLIRTTTNRRLFGISYAEKPGKIIYRAAVEENYPGEGKVFGCENLTVRKGEYISVFVPDFMKDIPAIGKAFEQLLKHHQIDPNGYCLEIYEGMADVTCLVPLTTDQ